MKLSVSIPDEDLSSSIATHPSTASDPFGRRAPAVRLLRASSMGDDYSAAWDEWAESDAEAWEATSADGLR
ncbi:MAG: antitoxin [Acidimicrobiales bacterium]